MADHNMEGRVQRCLDIFRGMAIDDGLLSSGKSQDGRRDMVNGKKESRQDEPATAKQIQFLRKLGADIPTGLTKKEASMRIEYALLRRVA